MAKITIGKMFNKQFLFLYLLLISISNQETNIFPKKIKHSNLKITDYANNYLSGKRKLENKENSVTVIAKGKIGEEINILYEKFKYLPNKVFINDSKENLGQVIKVNLTQDGENTITMIWDYSIQDCKDMFCDCRSLISIDMSHFDSSLITSMFEMFFFCLNLTSIDLTNFNTSSVMDMSSAFLACYKLKNLNISQFDTSSVTEMSFMFFSCHSLTSLDISKFNTTSTRKFTGMFYQCYSLTSIDLSNFDTFSLIDMDGMFSYCTEIKYLNLSNFYTENVWKMLRLFEGCINLKYIDFPNLDTTKGEYSDYKDIFINCTSLEYINIENYKGKDIFDSIPYNNNLTICLKDNDNIPNSLKQMKVKNNCSINYVININSFSRTTILKTIFP